MESRRWRTSPEAVEARLQSIGDDPSSNVSRSSWPRTIVAPSRATCATGRIVKGIESGFNTVDGDILVRNDQGQYQLGGFSISFKGQAMLTSRDTFEAFAG